MQFEEKHHQVDTKKDKIVNIVTEKMKKDPLEDDYPENINEGEILTSQLKEKADRGEIKLLNDTKVNKVDFT